MDTKTEFQNLAQSEVWCGIITKARKFVPIICQLAITGHNKQKRHCLAQEAV